MFTSLTGSPPGRNPRLSAPWGRRITPAMCPPSGSSRTSSSSARASASYIRIIRAVSSGGIVCLTGVGHGGGSNKAATADVAGRGGAKEHRYHRQRKRQQAPLHRAGEILARADRTWLSRLITRREKPENFKQALERKPDDIKVILQFPRRDPRSRRLRR